MLEATSYGHGAVVWIVLAETGRSALDKTAVESGHRSTANVLEYPAAGMNWAPGRASLPVPKAEELDLC